MYYARSNFALSAYSLTTRFQAATELSILWFRVLTVGGTPLRQDAIMFD